MSKVIHRHTFNCSGGVVGIVARRVAMDCKVSKPRKDGKARGGGGKRDGLGL
jgi:hypothetical protein